MNTKRHSERMAAIFGTNQGEPAIATTSQRSEYFNKLLNYLVRLRRDGTLDSQEFDRLIRKAAAAFIEAELNESINRVLGTRQLQNELIGILQ